MTELKRCPFCGAEPPTAKVLHPLDINMANWVVCGKCGVRNVGKDQRDGDDVTFHRRTEDGGRADVTFHRRTEDGRM